MFRKERLLRLKQQRLIRNFIFFIFFIFFIISVKKYGWAIQKSLFAWKNQVFTFSHTRENSKMFNITSNFFSFFNNKPPGT